MRIIRHLGAVNTLETRDVHILDTVTVRFHVDITRSRLAPTREVAEERLRSWLSDTVGSLAAHVGYCLKSAPDGFVVEAFLE